MLTGCDKSRISVGMIGNKMPSRISYHFHLFSGQKNGTVKVKNEQIINIEYEVEINDGSLSIGLQNPSKEIIWESNFTEGHSETNTVEVTADKEGKYKIIIKGQKAKGSFNVSWKVK
jgi:hypothetical protein